jgi:anti-sigma factor RsiW
VSCPQLLSIGAYTLGTLEPDDHLRITAHLEDCATCGAAVQEFVLLPGLLDRVDRADAVAAQPAPSESAFQRLAAAAASQRLDRRRRWAVAAAVAAAVIVAVVASSVVWSHTNQSRTTAVAASAGSVHARATLEPVATGSRLTLRLSGVPAEQRCRLIAVSRDGHRETAASWKATYRGTATINGTTGIPAATLASLVVETVDGRELVRLTLPSGLH